VWIPWQVDAGQDSVCDQDLGDGFHVTGLQTKVFEGEALQTTTLQFRTCLLQ
jgi:hypothetical protein